MGARRQTEFGRDIGERFVDHQPAAARGERGRQVGEPGGIMGLTVGIIGIGHHHHVPVSGPIKLADDFDLVAGGFPRRPVFAIGRSQHRDAAGRAQPGQRLDQHLRAGRGHDDAGIQRAVIGGSRRTQVRDCACVGQPLEGGRRNFADRIGNRVDPGRKIEPRLLRRAEPRRRPRKIAAVEKR